MTVVIPCYNYGHFLRGATLSALEQGGVQARVIIVDDASTDDSADVALALAEECPKVTTVIHPVNQGHIRTYNDGLARAATPYVMLLSADDLLAPGALGRAIGVMQSYPSVGFVYGFAPDFRDSPGTVRSFLPHCTVWPGQVWIDKVCRRGQNPVCTPTVVMRRDLLEVCGAYDPRAPHAGDLLLWMQAASRADVGYVNGVDQAFYRVHGHNMHITDFGGLLGDLEQRRSAFEALFDESTTLRADDPRRVRALTALATEAAALAEGADAAGIAALKKFARACGAQELVPSGPGRGLSLVAPLYRDLLGRVGWRYWRQVGLRL